MAIASGLGASLGIATESVVGTIVSPTRWLEFNSESLSLQKTVLQGMGLRGGGLYARGSRRVVTGRHAAGSIELDLATNGMGMLFRQMLGSSTSSLVSGSAYEQIHVPGSLDGKSLTIQKLVPNRSGVIVPFTYNGAKITDWSIDCAVGEIARLTVTVDAKDETTGTAAGTPSYSASTSVFHFRQGSIFLGGTASTTSGETSVAGGTEVGSIRSVSVGGSNGLTTGEDNHRFGSTTIEQAQADYRTISGSLEADFVDAASVYDVFSADTGTSLVLSFEGTTAISGSVYPTLEIIVPDVRFDGETPQVGGPDLITLAASFAGLEDALGNPAIQIRSLTSDTTIS